MAGTKTNPADKAPRTGKSAAAKGKAPRKAPVKASREGPPAPQGKPAARQRLWWLWLIPLVLAAGGAWVWFQSLAEYPSRIDRLEAQVARLAEIELGIAEAERQRAEDAALLSAQAQDARRAAERIRDALEARLLVAERNLEAIGSQSAGQQLGWRLDAADRLLALADRQNRFAKDRKGAALALREALELLGQLGDPRYGGLRAELEEQARVLERIPDRDIESVVVRLGALISRIEGLSPVVRPASAEVAAAAAEKLPSGGWDRALASTRRALRSLITVRRTDSGAGALLSEADAQTLQRLLAAELHLARLAYIQGDLQAYSAALVAARGRLARLYSPDDAGVADTVADIDALLELGQARETPDIAASLKRMRALRSD